MSFLPYGRSSPSAWALSGTASLALHGALVAVLTANLSQILLERQAEPARPEVQFRLDQLATDALAELEETLDEDLPDTADPTAPDTPEALPGEELAALAPDDLPFDAEAPDVDDAEQVAPEAAEARAPEEAQGAETEAFAPESELAETEPEEATPDAAEQVEAEAETAETLAPEDAPTQETPEEALALEAAPLEAVDATEADPLAPEPDAGTETAPETAAEAAPETAPAETLETATAPALDALPTVDALGPDASDAAVDAAPVDLAAEAGTAQTLEAAPVAPAPVEELALLLPEDPAAAPPALDASPLLSDDGVGAAPVAEPAAGTAPAALAPSAPAASAAAPAPGATLGAIEALPQVAALPEAQGAPPTGTAITPLAPGEDGTAPLAPSAPPPAVEGLQTESEQLALAAQPAAPPEPVVPDIEAQDTLEATAVSPPAEAEPRVRRVPRSPPTARDLAVAELIRRIRDTAKPSCLLALPRRVGADGIGLALISADDGAMAGYADALLTRPGDADIAQSRTLVDIRQCPALGFIAGNRDYPATRIGLRLERAEVPSGNRLSGVLTGVGDRSFALLLVDNNGVVQDLSRFVAPQDDALRFDVPVTRVGPRRDTKQLLVAVAADGSVQQITEQSGERAEDVFGDVSAALAREAALAAIAFDVR